jgi:hypothetical protein
MPLIPGASVDPGRPASRLNTGASPRLGLGIGTPPVALDGADAEARSCLG